MYKKSKIDYNQFPYVRGWVMGRSLLSNDTKIDKIDYFDRSILNFMIKNNQTNNHENDKGLKIFYT